MTINFSRFRGMKGEFEAEGLSIADISSEAIFAARRGLDYLVKIGGCEARRDADWLAHLEIRSIVAPMVETPFAMQKYMGMVQKYGFEHIGVTIETVTAVANIDDILDAGTALTGVTVGRTDLTASYDGDNVDSARTIEMTKFVATAAGARGLEVTMGGGVNKATREVFRNDAELRKLISCVETRKVVIEVEQFLDSAALVEALELEEFLLRRRTRYSDRLLPSVSSRLESLSKRS